MRRILLTLVLLGAAFLSGPANADVSPGRLREILKQARASITVPPEWDGIWTTADSVYSCAGDLQETDVSVDTLCAGAEYLPEDPGTQIQFNCTGSADATTYTLSCTGSSEVFENCTATYTLTAHGTRTGDTYFDVTTLEITYSGSGTGCEFLQGICTQTNTHGTRSGPAPAQYCSTPARSTTWGRVKQQYR